MGSGKSTIGPATAEALGYGFVDLDAEIESRNAASIPALFNEYGESGFRGLETAELRRAALLQDLVISCGGGIVARSENLALMRAAGTTVYLEVSPQTLVRRLSRSSHRPMLYGHDGNRLEGRELEARIRELIGARRASYEEADLTVSLDAVGRSEAARLIVAAIRASSPKRSI